MLNKARLTFAFAICLCLSLTTVSSQRKSKPILALNTVNTRIISHVKTILTCQTKVTFSSMNHPSPTKRNNPICRSQTTIILMLY